MKKILSILFTVFLLLFFAYYLLFFRFFNISYTFETNKEFFGWLFDDPTSLVLGLTPGTELHKAYLDFDPFQEDSVFNTSGEGTLPLGTPITGDEALVDPEVSTLPKYLLFSDSNQVYDVFNSLVTENQEFRAGQESSEEWNWETNMVTGTVMAKDFGRMMLGLNVTSPYYLANRGNPNVFKVHCTDETSVLVAQSNLEALEYDIDFFDRLSIGDIVHSYCTSEECIGLGRGCILVKAQSE